MKLMMASLQNFVFKHERVNEGQGARLWNSTLPPGYLGYSLPLTLRGHGRAGWCRWWCGRSRHGLVRDVPFLDEIFSENGPIGGSCGQPVQTWDGARKQKFDCQIGAQGYMMRGGAYGAYNPHTMCSSVH